MHRPTHQPLASLKGFSACRCALVLIAIANVLRVDAWQTTETQPLRILDPHDTSWSRHITDPTAQIPSDWDVDDDGDWEAPLIANPDPRPTISNPAYVDPLEAELLVARPFLAVYLALGVATALLDLSGLIFRLHLPSSLERLMQALTIAFSSPRMMLGSFIGGAGLSGISDPASIVHRIAFGLLLLISSQLSAALVKYFVRSKRPLPVVARPQKLPISLEARSFPCRETAIAASWAGMLLVLTASWWWFLVPLLVGVSGIYYHCRWASDALGGCALGLAVVWLLDWSIEGGWKSYNLMHVLGGTLVYGVCMRGMRMAQQKQKASEKKEAALQSDEKKVSSNRKAN